MTGVRWQKEISRFICQKCGWESPKWQGQCNECGEWNSLVETIVSTRNAKSQEQRAKISSIKPLRLSEVKSKSFSRVKTGIGEFDRVLGGGIVPGSVVLIAGEPGIGKSTLLTQLALNLASGDLLRSPDKNFLSSNRARKNILKKSSKRRDAVNTKKENFFQSLRKSSLNTKYKILNTVLYVCGEESPSQIKIRINRLTKQLENWTIGHLDNLLFLPETNVENIIASLSHCFTIDKEKIGNGAMEQWSNGLVIIDSIQTLWTEKLTGLAGSIGQIRECSNILLEIAKRTNIPVFLIGHITKEGAIAGPKVLEHLVDTVLYIEGDKQHDFRILRASKNRFGPTDEVGVFIMRDSGMEEVKNPSDIFLAEGRKQRKQSGSAIVAAMQGIRPILVEIQALVVPSQLAMPRRVASGIDYRRLQVLCAVLQKHCSLPLYSSDVFVNVAGGLALSEPAVDLGVCLATASSFKNKPLPEKSVAIGEVGLLGEIRKVSFMEKRLKEAKKLGYKEIIGEKENSLSEVIRRYLK